MCACAQINEELRKQLGAAGVKCNENTITNLNQAVTTPSDTPETPTPPGGVGFKANTWEMRLSAKRTTTMAGTYR
jgi:hypothetical protein